jgi:hypothetical protein
MTGGEIYNPPPHKTESVNIHAHISSIIFFFRRSLPGQVVRGAAEAMDKAMFQLTGIGTLRGLLPDASNRAAWT